MDKIDIPTRAVDKWREAGEAGFQVLPDLLLKKQAELGLSATDVVVLINLTMHWWYQEQRPFPRPTTIASRMGVDTRTVQRSLKKLAQSGLMTRETEFQGTSKERVVCDLDGLVESLVTFARTDPDFLLRTNGKGRSDREARTLQD